MLISSLCREADRVAKAGDWSAQRANQVYEFQSKIQNSPSNVELRSTASRGKLFLLYEKIANRVDMALHGLQRIR